MPIVTGAIIAEASSNVASAFVMLRTGIPTVTGEISAWIGITPVP